MNYEGLDELSRKFGGRLLSTFPASEPFARIIRDASGVATFQVEVAQPDTDRVLYLGTVKDEITIGFDEWHTQVGPFLGIDIEESVETAMGIIESFISETVVKVSYRDGKWIESSLSYRVAPGESKPNCTT